MKWGKKESLCRYDEVKDSEVRRFPRLLNVGLRVHHMHPFKREAVGDYTEEEDLKMLVFETGSDAATNRRLQAAPRGWQRQGRVSPRASRECGPTNTLMFAEGCGWRASGFHNCETVHFCLKEIKFVITCASSHRRERTDPFVSLTAFGRVPSSAAPEHARSCLHREPAAGRASTRKGITASREAFLDVLLPQEHPACASSVSWPVSPARLTTCQI